MNRVEDIRSSLPTTALRQIDGLPYPHLGSGKVREMYDLGDSLLIVATDRLSAFDVILPDGIPGKGILLTQLSRWWFDRMGDLGPHHLLDNQDQTIRSRLPDNPDLWHRSMIVRKLKPLAVEAVIRGALAGSGWKEYRQTGSLWGHPLPAGLVESSMLPAPLFTPTTKAAAGHDEPLTTESCRNLLGTDLHQAVLSRSLAIFERATAIAKQAGLILADTKFEFGLDDSGTLFLIDEILTPDSSRYWPDDDYQPGRPQTAFDKQFVRDYLETLDWDKTPPGPSLPAEIIQRTQQRYLEALQRLMGRDGTRNA